MTDYELLKAAAGFEDLARKAAHILGPASAAAKAISEVEAERAQGRCAAIVLHRKAWVVVRAAASMGGKSE